MIGHSDIITSLCFSNDGKIILTGSADKTARLWNINGKIIRVFTGHKARVSSVAFSPDENTILTGSWDNTARLWNIKNNDCIIYTGHTYYINSVGFSPSGNKILTCSHDKTARLWDLNGNELQIFSGHLDHVNDATFSPDGKFVLTGSADKTARLWEIQDTLTIILEKEDIQEMSIAQKLKYQILTYDSLQKCNNDNEIIEAVNFYIDQTYSARNNEQKKEMNIKSLNLLKKLAPSTDYAEISKLTAQIYAYMSQACLFELNYDLSIQYAELCMNADPEFEWIGTNLVVSYLMQGKMNKAELYLKKLRAYQNDSSYKIPDAIAALMKELKVDKIEQIDKEKLKAILSANN